MGKVIDKIIFNRLVAIITSFLLGVLKLFSSNKVVVDDDVPPPPTDKKIWFPKIRKRIEERQND